MALKSARVGIEVPSTTQTGTLGWLSKVSSGRAGGLASYQPNEPVTPTMTAEAWACRQFLGVGGPGGIGRSGGLPPRHGPKTDPYNLYYWYYGTLAMYQHGGDAWYRWNAQVRDEIGPPPTSDRPRGRQLGPRRQPVWRERRADLLHGARHLDARSVLPLLAPL